MKLIYCFNLLHCRLNKLKDSFFSLKPLLAQGRKRLLVPPTWLKGKVSQWWSAGRGILERMSPRMNRWCLYTPARLEKENALFLIFSYISLKSGPTLSTLSALCCDCRRARCVSLVPVLHCDLASFFLEKEEVLSIFIIEWKQVAL